MAATKKLEFSDINQTIKNAIMEEILHQVVDIFHETRDAEFQVELKGISLGDIGSCKNVIIYCGKKNNHATIVTFQVKGIKLTKQAVLEPENLFYTFTRKRGEKKSIFQKIKDVFSRKDKKSVSKKK